MSSTSEEPKRLCGKDSYSRLSEIASNPLSTSRSILKEIGEKMNRDGLVSLTKALQECDLLEHVIGNDIIRQQCLGAIDRATLSKNSVSRRPHRRKFTQHGRVTLYTDRSPASRDVERFLIERDLAVHKIDVVALPHRLKEMRRLLSTSTVPTVFFNDVPVTDGLEGLHRLAQAERNFLLRHVEKNDAPVDSTPALLTPLEAVLLALDSTTTTTVTPSLDEDVILCRMAARGAQPRDPKVPPFKKHPMSFSGQALYMWLFGEKELTAVDTTAFVQRFVDRGFIRCVLGPKKAHTTFAASSDVLYRWLGDEKQPPHYALNAAIVSDALVHAPVLLSRALAQHACQLPTEPIPMASGSDIRLDPTIHLLELSIYLQRVTLSSMSNEQRLVFFMNVYVSLKRHAQFNLKEGDKMSSRFFENHAYIINNVRFSLLDIELGILRANRNFSGKPYFPTDDPRAAFALSEYDPSVLCALYACDAPDSGEVFEEHSINQQLDRLTSLFIASCSLEWHADTNELVMGELAAVLDGGVDQIHVIEWVVGRAPKDLAERICAFATGSLEQIHLRVPKNSSTILSERRASVLSQVSDGTSSISGSPSTTPSSSRRQSLSTSSSSLSSACVTSPRALGSRVLSSMIGSRLGFRTRRGSDSGGTVPLTEGVPVRHNSNALSTTVFARLLASARDERSATATAQSLDSNETRSLSSMPSVSTLSSPPISPIVGRAKFSTSSPSLPSNRRAVSFCVLQKPE